MFAVVLALFGVLLVVVGWYESRIAAMVKNPVTRTRLVPRTQYDDVMGVDWVTTNH